MSSLLIGFTLLCMVFAATLRSEGMSSQIPVSSLILVLGGTFSLLWISVPMSGIRSLVRGMFGLLKTEPDFSKVHSLLDQLIKTRTLPQPSRNPLIDYAIELWEQGIEPDLFVVLLSQKRRELETRTLDAIQSLKNLAKYPPALGMIATVMGMVALFSALDQNKSNIGLSLSLAMTSTLIGLVLTNALLSPLADRLQIKQFREQRFYESIYQVLLLINNQEPEALIEGEAKLRAV